jgi:hypothetical protein
LQPLYDLGNKIPNLLLGVWEESDSKLKRLEGVSHVWKGAPKLVASWECVGKVELGREKGECGILMVGVHLDRIGMLDEIQQVIHQMTLGSDECGCST